MFFNKITICNNNIPTLNASLKIDTTFSIRIVADCGLQTFKAAKKSKRVEVLEFTAVSAIIFVHCCQHALYFQLNTSTYS